MKPIIKEETMWAVYGGHGLYSASNSLTRSQAIQRHLQDLGSCRWEDRKKLGDRVIKVIITPQIKKQ
jgi:hypothetical protein